MNNLFFRKQLFLLIGIFTYLFAQDDDQRDYLFLRDEKTFYINHTNNDFIDSIRLYLKAQIQNTEEIDINVKLMADKKGAYRFIDQEGQPRPQDRIIEGEEIIELTHQNILKTKNKNLFQTLVFRV